MAGNRKAKREVSAKLGALEQEAIQEAQRLGVEVFKIVTYGGPAGLNTTREALSQ